MTEMAYYASEQKKNKKKRVDELENQGYKILEDSWTLLNDEFLEDELKNIIEEIRALVQKHGLLNISVTTDRV